MRNPPKPEPVETARFQMDGPGDLLPKLSHDLQRIAKAKTRGEAAYAVFDFATTAWSMVDWSWEALKGRQTILTKKSFRDDVLLKEIPELEVCRLIATGAKHFKVSDQPREIQTMIISMRSKSLDPSGDGRIISTHEALAIVHWAGESRPCDEIFSEIYVKLTQFLRVHNLDRRSYYLTAPFDDPE